MQIIYEKKVEIKCNRRHSESLINKSLYSSPLINNIPYNWLNWKRCDGLNMWHAIGIYIYICIYIYIYVHTLPPSNNPIAVNKILLRTCGRLCEKPNWKSRLKELVYLSKLKCTLVQALRLCTGRTAHRGSRGIAFTVRYLNVQCTVVQALRLCTGRTAHKGSRGIAFTVRYVKVQCTVVQAQALYRPYGP